MAIAQKISPFLWFNNQAEEAATLYTSIFSNSRILNVSRWSDGGPAPKGSAMSVVFELEGQRIMALNGGPMYKFTPAFSLFVNCEDQGEVDTLWEKLLSDGGVPNRCGWLQDRFGLSWQIIPKALMELMGDPNPAKASRVTQAMMGMGKIIVADLEKAHASA